MSGATDAETDEGRMRPSSGYGHPLPFGFHRLTGVMNAIGTFWIFVLMVLITADVIGRGLFNTPIRGVIEIVTLSIVSIVFIQLADTLRNGRFTRADSLLGSLEQRIPGVATVFHLLFHLAGAAVLVVMCRASWPLLVESWNSGEYLGAIGDFQARVWPMRAVIVFGTACTALTFLFLAFADLRALLRSGSRA